MAIIVPRESGIGVDLIVKEPLAMFGTHPALTGRRDEVVLGKKSGKASIAYNLEQVGIADADDEAANEMLRRVKARASPSAGSSLRKNFAKIVDGMLVAKGQAARCILNRNLPFHALRILGPRQKTFLSRRSS